VIVSIDVKGTETGPRVYDHIPRLPLAKDPVTVAREAEAAGAGEVFVNSVDRDGGKLGYDLELAASVSSAVHVPVVICGGVGRADHFAPALTLPNISGVAAANYDTHFDYEGAGLDGDLRLARKDDAQLREMLFEFHPAETI
jgi:cyclase